MCLAAKGRLVVWFAERPVQSIAKSSLPFCSESFHVVGRVKALSHTPNRAAYPRYYRSLCNFSRAKKKKRLCVHPVRELCS